MTATINHVLHRALLPHDPDEPYLMYTACGRRFLPSRRATRDTRHHEPARSRCPECWR